MSKGVLLYAHNNPEIDYFKIACVNAKLIKYNLNVPITVVSDKETIDYSLENLKKEFIENTFDNIITVDRNYNFSNKRNFNDGSFSTKNLEFYNINHCDAYEISPYDETLFIDSDYLIMSNSLNKCWGSHNDIMLTSKLLSVYDNRELYHMNVDPFGIKLYWATVIYFKKSLFSKTLFSIVNHVQDNYQYYKELYSFSNLMFRNDNAFSIAIHMLNGFTSDTPVAGELPIPGLVVSWDNNDIYKINGKNDISLYVEKENEKGNFLITRLKNQDTHFINKWSIVRKADEFIKAYGK